MKTFAIHLPLLLSIFFLSKGYAQSPLELTQAAYLKASNADAEDEFGFSVAVSGDLMVVGASQEDSSAPGANGDQSDNLTLGAGAAYVFRRINGEWVQEAYLKASNPGRSADFGTSVAVSGDTIVVGAPDEQSLSNGINGIQIDRSGPNFTFSGTPSGAVYVFRYVNGQWTQEAFIKASNRDITDDFGTSVSISEDIMVVGANNEESSATGVNGDQNNDAANDSGAAYVFRRENGQWSQEAYLKASNTGVDDEFGKVVSISGETIVISTELEDSASTGVNGDQNDNSASRSGAAYVFQYVNDQWVQEAYLKASNASADDRFGISAAISGDTIVVGASEEDSSASGVNGDQNDDSASRSGAAYIFRRVSGQWVQEAYLKSSNSEFGDGFGTAVAISGETITVGAIAEDSSATGVNGDQNDNSAFSSGSAYVFRRINEEWVQESYLKASNSEANVFFGQNVAISETTIAVGTQFEDGTGRGINNNAQSNGARETGAAYLYEMGVAVAEPEIVVEIEGEAEPLTDELQFARTALNGRREQEIVIRNDGEAPLIISSISLDSSSYQIEGFIAGVTVQPNATTTFTLVFSPTVGDNNPATLTINSNDSDESFTSITLLGQGGFPAITLFDQAGNILADGGEVDLGSVMSGNVTSVNVILRNTGPASLNLRLTSTESFFISSDQDVIAPGEEALLTLRFEPGFTGDQNGVVELGFDEVETALFSLSLRGTSLTPLAFAQSAYVKASNTNSSDLFGESVAISGDTIVIGAMFESGAAVGVNGDQSAATAFSSSGAAYVFRRIDGQLVQEAYLKASNTNFSDRFGASVAISGDTIVVGATREDSNSTGVNGDQSDNSELFSGAAYVFRRINGQWSQEAYLKASNTGSFDEFGTGVAISGNLIVVGTPNENSATTGVNGNQSDNSADNAGAAYVFRRENGQWSQEAYLKASNTNADDLFGYRVAISGETILVSALTEDSSTTGVNGEQSDNSASDSGAAYVFRLINGQWNQEAYLKASNTDASDRFGSSVAISGDAIVVGATGEDSNGTGVNGVQNNILAVSSGAAYVFRRINGQWSQEACLKASNTDTSDAFGESVGISGEMIVVGANLEDGSSRGVNGDQSDNSAGGSGAAYVFRRADGEWMQEYYLKAFNTGENDQFGTSVAISGQTILVGAQAEDSSAIGVNGSDPQDNLEPNSGAVYMFSGIAQQAYLKASNADVDDNFGVSIAIFGNTAVVGAPNDDSNATGVNGDQSDNSLTNSGAAYVYTLEDGVWTQQAYLKASNTGAADLFGVSVAIFEDLIVVGAEGENSATGEEDDNSANNAGAAYLFRRTGTTWSQEAYLKASNPSAGDAFGTSSAISGNTIIVGAHLEDSSATGVNEDGSDNAAADSGAAYVFVNDGSGWREEAFLKASNADPADQFGFSVGLSDDIAVVGARFEDRNIEGLEDAGAAYIFVRNNGVWSQEDILRGTFPDANDRFGESVAISGETAVVGSLLEDSSSRGVNSGGGGLDDASNAGAAYVFVRDGTVWNQEAYLKSSNSSSADQFGGSVAINKDTIVIGARAEDTLATGVNNVGEDNGAINSGSAYVFQRIGTTWAEEAYLKASNTDAADQFGFSVGVSVDTVVVGARFENGASREINEGEQDNSALNAGAAYIFTIPVKVVAMFPGYGGGINAAGLSGADASPLAIPFNDGVENILKYAFNLDLSGPDSRVLEVGGNAGLPRCSVIESGGERFFRLQYLEREDNQLVYTPQISSNLALDSFASVTGTRTEQVIDSEWSLITIDRRIDSASTPRDFFRVMVSFQ